MEFTTNYIEGVVVIKIKGELDAKTSPELTAVFKSQLDEGHTNFIFDLLDLNYSSSAGIRIFLGSAREARNKGGDLRISSVQSQVNKIFNLSKFDKIVKIFDTTDEALQSYK